jgi:hypothetical protein
MNKKIVSLLLFFVMGFALVSCERYPITDLNSVPSPYDSWPYPWYIYDDELNTKGLFSPVIFNDDGNTGDLEPDTINFSYGHNAYRGKYCIKFEWHPKNGKTWCGFGLATTEEPTNPHSAKDMTTSGYTKLEFYARGKITAGATVTIGIPRNDYNGKSVSPIDFVSITSLDENVWMKKTINLTSGRTKANWNTQKFYLSVSIEGASSNGATVYLDDIKFVKE